MAGDRPDWVVIKMTAKGEEISKGGPMRIMERNEFIITPGGTLEVTLSDWETQISRHSERDGEAILEVVQ